MIQVQFAAEEEQLVRQVAQQQNVTESLLVHDVGMRWLEDRRDYAAGMAALSHRQSTISLEEMERRSDVAG